MSYDDDDGDDSRAREMVHDTIKRAQTAQRLYWEEAPTGVSKETHLALAEVVLEYHQTLWPYRNAEVVDADDYPDISALREAVGRQSKHIVTSSGRWGSSTRYETQPMVLEFEPSRLVDVIAMYHDLANKLGFGAQTAAPDMPHDNPGGDDLEALLEARGQSDAAENLPGGS